MMLGADPNDADNGDPATARLDAFGSLDQTELAGLAELAGVERALERGTMLWQQGKRLPSLYLLVDGWMVSTIATPDGRDLTAKVHLPGDLLGLPSLAFSKATESVMALTPVQLRPLALHSFGHLFEAHPRIAVMMFLVSQQERAALMDRLAVGCTASVTQRVAAFFCQLLERMRRSFPETMDSLSLPLKRKDVADLVGVSSAQLATVLKQLRADDIIGWTEKVLTIVDEKALADIAKLPVRQLVQDAHWFPSVEEGGPRDTTA